MHQRGLTLIELMVTIALAGLLLMAGVPFFGDYTNNARLRENGNALYGEAMFAQSEAIKRNTTVRLSIAGGVIDVRDMSTGDGVSVRSMTMSNGVGMAGEATIDFGSDGRPSPFGTAVSINLGMSGVTCSADQRCPGLRVDAGGAVRLCGNHLSGCD